MKKELKRILLPVIFIVAANTVKAQYPDIPSDVQRSADSLMRAAVAHSDSAWAIAYPIVQEEAAKYQRPYVPWAARPVDLPQADIPAFPVQKAVVNLVLVEEEEK